MLNQLVQLVRSFSDGEENYAEFRQRFVMGFLALHHEDAAIENLVNAVEMACANFDEGNLGSLSELREELATLVSRPHISFEVVDSRGIFSRVPVPGSPKHDSGSDDSYWPKSDYALTA